MRSIKNFSRSGGDGGDKSDIKKNTEALADKYVGKSEDELISELMRTAAVAKRDGSFSARQLDEFVGFVSPSLDEESRARLNYLVGMIKGD